MRPAALRERLRSRTVRLAALLLVVLLAGSITVALVSSSPAVRTRSQFVSGTPEPDGTTVSLDTTLYLPATTPAPAVLLTQGFGGDKGGLDGEARTFARHGYVVLAYSARGFGRSGGLIHFASPHYEIRDARLLVDHLARLPVVEKRAGAPRIAAAGSSYGGAISLLLAAADHRIRAVSADITWSSLQQAFFPNNTGSAGGGTAGAFKKLWVGLLFGNGFPSGPAGAPRSPRAASCGRFAPGVCAAYQASAAAGRPTPALRALMRAASPARVLSRITAPTQLIQGEQDSLFPLTQADANARGIAAHGTPVSVVWRTGGHDTGGGGDVATADGVSWFDRVFSGSDLTGPQPFTFAENEGVISAASGEVEQSVLRAPGYPGLDGTPQRTRTVSVSGAAQPIASPAGGTPAVITSIPGLGGVSSRLDTFLSGAATAPGQTALFTSTPVRNGFSIVGAPRVRITVTPGLTRDAVLFAGLRDLAPDGTSSLPSQLVAPVRLTGLTPGRPRTVTVRLPSVVQKVLPGHRLVLSVSASDFAYDGPSDARTYGISLPGGSSTVVVPTASGTVVSGGAPLAWLLTGVGVVLAALLLVALVLVRRRRVLRPAPELADVPVDIRGLVKEYAGGYRAVDDVSFRVERGHVVGLLGPNGAGKTTALRVLVGLITPTAGELYLFGEPVAPGAPVLARLGAFIEGPGFLPHLSGRENLRLYWAATGRPDDEAEFATALDIAGLGASIDRKVRTYSHGMKQRLGIAQAMLGLPELLVLDEPTNGLDPPQIAEMREVMKRYAETGRTVVVSSHLLAEVEQTCTHVVVMHKGRLVSAGSVAELAASDETQLSVSDPAAAAKVLAAAGIRADLVRGRRPLEEVFLELIDESPDGESAREEV